MLNTKEHDWNLQLFCYSLNDDMNWVNNKKKNFLPKALKKFNLWKFLFSFLTFLDLFYFERSPYNQNLPDVYVRGTRGKSSTWN